MKKITFKPRQNKHDNDCWCDAIALATNKQYDTIYKKFKEFTNNDGSLLVGYFQSYLQTNGYVRITSSLSLYDAMQVYNNKNGIVIELEDNHTIYVKDNVIHEGIREVGQIQYFNNYPELTAIYVKLDDEFKLIG